MLTIKANKQFIINQDTCRTLSKYEFIKEPFMLTLQDVDIRERSPCDSRMVIFKDVTVAEIYSILFPSPTGVKFVSFMTGYGENAAYFYQDGNKIHIYNLGFDTNLELAYKHYCAVMHDSDPTKFIQMLLLSNTQDDLDDLGPYYDICGLQDELGKRITEDHYKFHSQSIYRIAKFVALIMENYPSNGFNILLNMIKEILDKPEKHYATNNKDSYEIEFIQ